MWHPTGQVLFDDAWNGLANEWRVAFDFMADGNSHTFIHAIGAIHVVEIPWYVEYEDLSDEQNSFVALSGHVYTVTDETNISVASTDDGYHIQLETTASVNDDTHSEVPVVISFSAVQGDNRFGGFDVVSSEIIVGGEEQSDYQTLDLYNRYLSLVEENGKLSGKALLTFGDNCGNYLRLDLLFRDIVIE
jgi:hypothetical protein